MANGKKPLFRQAIALTSIVSVVALSGCATLSYEEPQSGPRARVRFSTDSPNMTVLYRYADQMCLKDESEMMRMRNGICLPCKVKRLGMPLWQYNDNAAKEVFIEAGTPFYGLYLDTERTGTLPAPPLILTYYQTCGVPFSYTFRENEDYDVVLNRAQCRVEIFKLQNDDKGEMKRISQATASMDSERCREAIGKRRLY